MGQREPILIDLEAETSEEMELEEDSPGTRIEEASSAPPDMEGLAPVKEKGKEIAEGYEESDKEVFERLKRKYNFPIEAGLSQPPASSPHLLLLVILLLLLKLQQKVKEDTPHPPPQSLGSGLTNLLLKIYAVLCQSHTQILEEVARILEAQRIDFRDLCTELLLNSPGAPSSPKPYSSPKPDSD